MMNIASRYSTMSMDDVNHSVKVPVVTTGKKTHDVGPSPALCAKEDASS
jgi:hypothetical protein